MEQSLVLQHHVQLALAQKSGINCSNIGVVCNADQQITLTGTVHSDGARLAALEAARTVSGNSVVKDALVVHTSPAQPQDAGNVNKHAVLPQLPIALDAVPVKADGRQSFIATF